MNSIGGSLTIFDKGQDTAEEGRSRIASSPPEARFLQPSIRLRYNYYIQLVAIKRDWMRVPNLNISQRFAKGGVEAGRAPDYRSWSCTSIVYVILASYKP